ncbi:hypothetical protein [Microbispora triticiradicis]|uniref:hypothetical protein n=1 Tax=Microbispora triticiradicis TaxID=2200763 RepID=UPI000DBE6024|nr:hypothetical protein [Microbispora triticiradicis]
MPDKPLSFSATCALLVLMAEDWELSNPELKEKYGVTITGKERTALNAGGYVDSRKQGRSYSHVLTDKGWHHASELFRDGVGAPATGFAAAAVRALVAGIQRHVSRSESSLADVFGRQDSATTPPTGVEETITAQEKTVSRASDASVATFLSDDVETSIRKAYAQLADGPNAWVSLTRLRPLLGEAPRELVDAALRRMITQPDVHIVPWESQKNLSQEDRDAAVIIGDQPKHRILIGA